MASQAATHPHPYVVQPMLKSRRKHLYAIGNVCLTIGVLGGCAGGQKILQESFLLRWVPERRDDPADLARYGPIPSAQISQLRELAEQAASREPEVQRRLAIDLAERVETEEDPLLRSEVARALGALQVTEAAEALQNAVNDGDPDVRIAVCAALGQQGGIQAAETLGTIIRSDSDFDVRLAATRALRGSREPAALEALAVALDDSDPALQFRAIQTMREISPVDYGSDVGAWRQFAQGGTPPATESEPIAGWLRRRFR